MKAQVLLPKIFNFPFTYKSNTENKLGNLVEVPFGTKTEIGVIWKSNYSEPKNIKIKDIRRKTQYSIDKKMIDFIEWFSSYNMVSIGLVLKMVIGGSDNFIRKKDNLAEAKRTHKKFFELNKEQSTALKYLEKGNLTFQFFKGLQAQEKHLFILKELKT